MKTRFLHILLMASLCIMSGLGVAHADSMDDDIQNIREMLHKRFPGVTIRSITPSKAPGWIEVIAGTQVVYFDRKGKFMFDGALVEVATRKNLTEAARSEIRLAAISKISDEEMLVYRPEKVNHTVTVVTDIDCPYCRKLHSEMDDYMENNIKVRYILMPLKGKKDYDKTVSVWCSEDRNLAMDIAKAGGDVDEEKCSHPLVKHEKIARELGVSGTPAIVLEDGRLLPGYLPVEDLMKELAKTSS